MRLCSEKVVRRPGRVIDHVVAHWPLLWIVPAVLWAESWALPDRSIALLVWWALAVWGAVWGVCLTGVGWLGWSSACRLGVCVVCGRETCLLGVGGGAQVVTNPDGQSATLASGFSAPPSAATAASRSPTTGGRSTTTSTTRRGVSSATTSSSSGACGWSCGRTVRRSAES
jgi:hypothetical protein